MDNSGKNSLGKRFIDIASPRWYWYYEREPLYWQVKRVESLR